MRRRAYDTLAASYWKPVYKYIRIHWHALPDDAEDLTQEFFSQALEKRWLERYDPGRARFRTYLRTCVDGSVANGRKAAGRLKRGGAVRFVDMDVRSVEGEMEQSAFGASADVDEFFRHEWVRSLFELAIDRLKTELTTDGKATHFAIFERYDVLGPQSVAQPTYAELSAEYGIPETQVTNFLSLARRRFRHHVLEVLSELTGSDEEFAAEARDLLGVEI